MENYITTGKKKFYVKILMNLILSLTKKERKKHEKRENS
jgi:hypothetical protein